jgi:hypothetical protein
MNRLNLNTLMMCALRYAIGRKTYITEDVSDIIIANRQELTVSSREVMIRDIHHAIETNNYGHQMDKEAWERLLDVLEASDDD